LNASFTMIMTQKRGDPKNTVSGAEEKSQDEAFSSVFNRISTKGRTSKSTSDLSEKKESESAVQSLQPSSPSMGSKKRPVSIDSNHSKEARSTRTSIFTKKLKGISLFP
jgi:hypothetical protein